MSLCFKTTWNYFIVRISRITAIISRWLLLSAQTIAFVQIHATSTTSQLVQNEWWHCRWFTKNASFPLVWLFFSSPFSLFYFKQQTFSCKQGDTNYTFLVKFFFALIHPPLFSFFHGWKLSTTIHHTAIFAMSFIWENLRARFSSHSSSPFNDDGWWLAFQIRNGT